jgi:hypothetical protein
MKKRLFLSSAVMTGVLAVALSTGTYAWYTVSGAGEVKVTGANTVLNSSVENYAGLGGKMTLQTTFKAVTETGKATAKGELADKDKAEKYNGKEGDEENNVYQGLAMEGKEYDLPTFEAGELKPVDLTNKKGHTYANTKAGLTDVTDKADMPFGVFSFEAKAMSSDKKLTKNGLGQSVADTQIHKDWSKVAEGEAFSSESTYYTHSEGQYVLAEGLTSFAEGTEYYTEITEAVGQRYLVLTATVQATGHVRLSRTKDATVFSNKEENAYSYTIILGYDGTITFETIGDKELVTGEQFNDTEEKAIDWNFTPIYYSVAPEVTKNSTLKNADDIEQAGHNGGKDGVKITWTSSIQDKPTMPTRTTTD